MKICLELSELRGECRHLRSGERIILGDGGSVDIGATDSLCLHICNSLLCALDAETPATLEIDCRRWCPDEGATLLFRVRREPEPSLPEIPLALRQALRLRGIERIKEATTEFVILPRNRDPQIEGQHYEYLKKYSFRLLLRDILKKASRDFVPADLTHYCSVEAVSSYLEFLEGAGIIRCVAPGRYCFGLPHIDSFGATLDWLVAQIIRREFGGVALWDVRVKDAVEGGDYDVLGMLEEKVVYVEVKSSPPKNIHQHEVARFLERLECIAPCRSVFLVDTQLRMEDKINKIFRWAIRERSPNLAEEEITPAKVTEGVFRIPNIPVLITNSKPDIVTNLGLCLRNREDF